MGQIGPILAAPGSVAISYAERLANGIDPKIFSSFARPGGVVIRSNHPAFVYGHLALYPQRVIKLLGAASPDVEMPASYEALFKNGVDCQDDPQCRMYPPMQELTTRCLAANRAAQEALRGASDELLVSPNPAEGRMRELFPTIGGMLSFYVSGHAQLHLGQVSAWRRAMGLPAA